MQFTSPTDRLKISVLVAALLVSSSFSAAQVASQGGAQQQSAPSGVRIDPSAGPLQPGEPQQGQSPQVPLPEAPQPVVPPAQVPPPQQPLGTAAAEQINTSGGGASRPAGNAIAPVKQHQYRSMIIKLGAVAAAGIAVGTVYGLSHGTPGVPPHSASAAK